MKYLVILLMIPNLIACKANLKSPHHYICFNAILPIQSIRVSTGDPGVEDLGSSLRLTSESGDGSLTIPKSLCEEVSDASGS